MDVPKPFAIIIHQDYVGDIESKIAQYGEGYLHAYSGWHRSHFRYLALITHTVDRIRTHTPEVYFLVSDQEVLERIKRTNAEHQLARPITWHIFVAPSSTADRMLCSALKNQVFTRSTSFAWIPAARSRATPEGAPSDEASRQRVANIVSSARDVPIVREPAARGREA